MATGFDPSKFNPHDPAFLADPYPTYSEFRQKAPLYPVEPYGSTWIFRYADCDRVLNDTATWVKNPPPSDPPPPAYGPYEMMSYFPPGLFFADPPLHTTLRELLNPLFDGPIQGAPAIATQAAEGLLQTASAHGRIELVSDYALPLPSSVLFTLFGIPNDPGVWEGLVTYTQAIATAHDITQSVMVRGLGATCSMALNSFFEGLLVSGRATSGLFSDMCSAFRDQGLDTAQIQACACDFLVAGYLSTTFIIGTGVRNLLQNPTQLKALRANPALITGAVEEMLRFDAPAQLVDRCAAVDTNIGRHKFKAGDRITLVLGSANRDRQFRDPDKFLIRRPLTPQHLSFGDGIHHCIGAPLIRLVAPVAIEQLLTQFPTLEFDGIAQWQTDPYLRAVASLPLSF